MDFFYGTYKRFDTASKNEGAALIGADNLVGDIYDIEFVTEDDKKRAYLKNKFGKCVAFFDDTFSRKLSVFAAREWKLAALLSFVAYSDKPEPGIYWGEAAVVCYDPAFTDACEPFIKKLGAHLADGIRPDIDLSKQALENLVESKGEWFPKGRVPMPQKAKGSAIVKSERSASEKLIEQGRAGNKGCYLVSILFLVALVAAAIFGLKSCGLF